MAMLILAGCRQSTGIERVVVQGRVTLNGAPVEDGQIRFIPVEGTAGPVTIAPIIKGRYVCDDKGGVPLGKHRIEILAWDPTAPPGGRGEPPRPQWAPAKYNEQSELVETIESNGSDLAKNFDLYNASTCRGRSPRVCASWWPRQLIATGSLAAVQFSEVFVGGAEGPNGTAHFRIPALIATPYGNLVAIAVARPRKPSARIAGFPRGS
jgi:hypothetical protein